MIYFKKEDYDEIVAFAQRELPDECCGLLGGHVEGSDAWVDQVYYLTNTDHSPEHFSMDPKEQLQALKDMRSRGLTMLGNFHSHPESPSRPSEEDKRLAFDPNVRYLILSLLEETPVFRSFHIREGEVTVEEIQIRDK